MQQLQVRSAGKRGHDGARGFGGGCPQSSAFHHHCKYGREPGTDGRSQRRVENDVHTRASLHHQYAISGIEAGGVTRDAHQMLASDKIGDQAAVFSSAWHEIQRVEMPVVLRKVINSDDGRLNGRGARSRYADENSRDPGGLVPAIADIRAVYYSDRNRRTVLQRIQKSERARSGLKICRRNVAGARWLRRDECRADCGSGNYPDADEGSTMFLSR